MKCKMNFKMKCKMNFKMNFKTNSPSQTELD